MTQTTIHQTKTTYQKEVINDFSFGITCNPKDFNKVAFFLMKDGYKVYKCKVYQERFGLCLLKEYTLIATKNHQNY